MVSFTFDNVLAPGRYSPVFQLTHRGSGLDVIDRFEGSFSFVVTGPGALGGLDRPAGAVGDHPCTASESRASAHGMSVRGATADRAAERRVMPYEALGRPISGPRAPSPATGAGSGT